MLGQCEAAGGARLESSKSPFPFVLLQHRKVIARLETRKIPEPLEGLVYAPLPGEERDFLEKVGCREECPGFGPFSHLHE